MKKYKYPPLHFILQMHDQLIEEYGGKKGILDLALLQSAIEMPKAFFNGKYLHRTVYDKAAAYLYHMTKNHPFVDGNKRTAGMTALLFLSDNNPNSFFILDKDYEELILQVAKGKSSKKEISKFFRVAFSIGKKKSGL